MEAKKVQRRRDESESTGNHGTLSCTGGVDTQQPQHAPREPSPGLPSPALATCAAMI